MQSNYRSKVVFIIFLFTKFFASKFFQLNNIILFLWKQFEYRHIHYKLNSSNLHKKIFDISER